MLIWIQTPHHHKTLVAIYHHQSICDKKFRKDFFVENWLLANPYNKHSSKSTDIYTSTVNICITFTNLSTPTSITTTNFSWSYFSISKILGLLGSNLNRSTMYFFFNKKNVFTLFLRHLPHCCNVWQQFLGGIRECLTAKEFHRLNVEDSCLQLTPEIRVFKTVIDYVPCRWLHSLKHKNTDVKNIV